MLRNLLTKLLFKTGNNLLTRFLFKHKLINCVKIKLNIDKNTLPPGTLLHAYQIEVKKPLDWNSDTAGKGGGYILRTGLGKPAATNNLPKFKDPPAAPPVSQHKIEAFIKSTIDEQRKIWDRSFTGRAICYTEYLKEVPPIKQYRSGEIFSLLHMKGYRIIKIADEDSIKENNYPTLESGENYIK